MSIMVDKKVKNPTNSEYDGYKYAMEGMHVHMDDLHCHSQTLEDNILHI